MMPTFPSPSLKFRTSGFPRYGFKASLIGGACLDSIAVKPAPGIPAPLSSLHHPSPAAATERMTRLCVQVGHRAATGRCARGLPSLPQGSLAPARVLLSRAIVAYSDPIRQSRRHAALSRPRRLYAAPSLCGSASATRETFPTFPAVLSTRAVDLAPVSPLHPPVIPWHSDTRLPRSVSESPLTTPVSASNLRRVVNFRRCIVRFMLRPACLPRPPDWLRRDAIISSGTSPSEDCVTPALDAIRRRTALGVRLDGRTGNLPSSGLSPDQYGR
jgi:hypothetical protein